MMVIKKENVRSWLLIILCWLVYTSSLIGKYGYDATNVAIKEAFNLDKGSIGIVSSCFFFAYGAGQIINGILVKKYNVKYVVAGALFLSAVCNLAIALSDSFEFYKYIWLVNGLVASTLWCSTMKVLSLNLKQEYLAKAVMVMSTTVAIGTAITYGLSALFVKFYNYRYSFYLAAILLPIVGIIWFSFYDFLTLNEIKIHKEENVTKKEKKIPLSFIILLVMLALISIATNLIRQGLTTWVPSILKETYSLSDSLSIILTLALPLISILGTYFAILINKKIKDYVALCAILFACAIIFLLIVVFKINTLPYLIILFCFSFVCMMMAGVNNVTTSMAPLYLRKKIDSGFLAGLLNGFCYVGSTLSSFGLGGIADTFGWNGVFILLLLVCIFVIIISAIYLLIIKRILKA